MSEYEVPKDFPRPVYAGAVAGAQPKLLLVQYEDGTYGEPGRSPREIHHNWKYCEKVIEHLRVKSLESAAGKRAHMTQEAILDQYLTRFARDWLDVGCGGAVDAAQSRREACLTHAEWGNGK